MTANSDGKEEITGSWQPWNGLWSWLIGSMSHPNKAASSLSHTHAWKIFNLKHKSNHSFVFLYGNKHRSHPEPRQNLSYFVFLWPLIGFNWSRPPPWLIMWSGSCEVCVQFRGLLMRTAVTCRSHTHITIITAIITIAVSPSVQQT